MCANPHATLWRRKRCVTSCERLTAYLINRLASFARAGGDGSRARRAPTASEVAKARAQPSREKDDGEGVSRARERSNREGAAEPVKKVSTTTARPARKYVPSRQSNSVPHPRPLHPRHRR